MLVAATDWTTIASLATAAGTLVLALATFAATRSANRSARIAEVALEEQRRPVLTQSRLDDPPQKLMFVDGYWGGAAGGQAEVIDRDGVIYLTISLRNVGSGMAVCQAWGVQPTLVTSGSAPQPVSLDRMRQQGRDIYIPPGDIGIWQAAIREPDDPLRSGVAETIASGEGVSVELLYTDLVGGHRTVTRFGLRPVGETWYATMSRHWQLDASGPRPER